MAITMPNFKSATPAIKVAIPSGKLCRAIIQTRYMPTLFRFLFSFSSFFLGIIKSIPTIMRHPTKKPIVDRRIALFRPKSRNKCLASGNISMNER